MRLFFPRIFIVASFLVLVFNLKFLTISSGQGCTCWITTTEHTLDDVLFKADVS